MDNLPRRGSYGEGKSRPFGEYNTTHRGSSFGILTYKQTKKRESESHIGVLGEWHPSTHSWTAPPSFKPPKLVEQRGMGGMVPIHTFVVCSAFTQTTIKDKRHQIDIPTKY